MSGIKLLFLAIGDEFKALISLGFIDFHHQDQRHSNAKHSNHRANHPRSISPIGAIRGAIIDIPKPPNHETDSEERAKKSREKLHFRFQIGAAIAVIIGFPIVAIQSFANLRQANAAEKQLAEMNRENRLGERAWVAPYLADAEQNGADTNIIIIAVHFKNTGKTPARVTYQWLGFGNNIKQADDLDRSFYGANYFDMHVPVAPGGEFIMNTSQANHPITRNDIRGNSNGVVEYVYGTVWYEDIFGSNHWAKFGYVIPQDLRMFQMAPNGAHNGCDEW